MNDKEKKAIVNEVLTAINNGIKVKPGVTDGSGLYPEMWTRLRGDLAKTLNQKYLEEDVTTWCHIEYHGMNDAECVFCIEIVGDANTESVGTERDISKDAAKAIIDYFETEGVI